MSNVLAEEKKLNYDEFMQDLILKITWNLEKWKLEGLLDTKLHFFIKYIKYWYQNLKEVMNKKAMVFTTYSSHVEGRPLIQKILQDFKKQVGMKGLKGYSYTKNSNFIVFVFENEKFKEEAVQNFKTSGEYYIVTSEVLNVSSSFNFKISWLPPDIELDAVSKLLFPFMDIIEIKNISTVVDEEDEIMSGYIEGKAMTKAKIKFNEIPYIMLVEDYEALISIPNRDPICFSCYKVGHVIIDCPMPFCKTCRTKLPRNHEHVNKKLYANLFNSEDKHLYEKWSQLQNVSDMNQDTTKKLLTEKEIQEDYKKDFKLKELKEQVDLQKLECSTVLKERLVQDLDIKGSIKKKAHLSYKEEDIQQTVFTVIDKKLEKLSNISKELQTRDTIKVHNLFSDITSQSEEEVSDMEFINSLSLKRNAEESNGSLLGTLNGKVNKYNKKKKNKRSKSNNSK